MTARSLMLQAGRKLRSLDSVALTIATILGVLAAATPGQATDSLRFTLSSLWSIAPFFLLSVSLASAIAATGADRQLAEILRGRPSTVILIASVFGALSPLCSVSVIPIAFALMRSGVPLAPVMAFWLGSPLMDPEIFILTAAIIDLPFALARAASAIAMGLIAGYATHALSSFAPLARPLKAGIDPNALGGVWSCPTCFAETEVVWTFWRHADRWAAFRSQAIAIGLFLLKWLTLAFVVESLMVAYVPAELVAAKLGGAQWWVIPASVLVGVPTYLNGYAAIPTVSALLDMGAQPGAALAFMTAGEVTSIPTALSVFVLVRPTVFAWYLLLGIVGSLLVGYGYQAWGAP